LIGLDTNILVRVAVGDDPEQTRLAKERLSALTTSEPGFVTHVVMVEIWWELTRTYQKTPAEALAYLTSLTELATIVVQDRALVVAALAAVRDHQAGFADALIVAVSTANHCPRVETFDSAAIKRAGMQPLSRGE